MPIFHYKALKESGNIVQGVIDATTSKEARTKLRKDKIFVTEIRSPEEISKKPRVRFFQRELKSPQIAIVTRQLSTLLGAGIPLADSLNALIEQIPDRKIEAIFRDVRENITQGATLADSLSLHPRYFSSLYISMIKAGEASGTLSEVTSRLADYLQKKNRLKNRIRAALTYPTMMIIVGIIVVIVLVTFVIPKITELLKKRGAVLPLPTEILVGVSNFFRHYGWMLLLVLFALGAIIKTVLIADKAKLIWDSYKLKIPVVGELLKKQAISRFSVTFSTLLKSGIPALECLVIVKDTVGNRLMAKVIDDIHSKVIQGSDISTPIKKSRIFPPVVGYMIAVGEASGELSNILDRISQSYDEEIELSTQRLTGLLEPLIIIFLAITVGFIILAVILPMVRYGATIR